MSRLANAIELDNTIELGNCVELSNHRELNPDEVLAIILELLNASNASTTGGTCWCYNFDAVLADGTVLKDIPAGYPRITGGRWVDTVAGGAALGSEWLVDPSFDDAAAWDLVGVNATVSGGAMSISPAAWRGIEEATTRTVEVGATYLVTAVSMDTGIDGIKISVGNVTSDYLNANGASALVVASDTSEVSIWPDPDYEGNLYEISIKKVIPHWSRVDAAGVQLNTNSLVENVNTNQLLNSDAPATQTTTSLGVGKYTLSVFGTGSVICSAGTATITGAAAATEGSPNTITVTAAGTVTVTETTPVDYFQLEAGDIATSIIITGGAVASRDADIITNPLPPVWSAKKGFARFRWTPLAAGQSGTLISSYVDADNYIEVAETADEIVFNKLIATVNHQAVFSYTHLADTEMECEFYWDDVEGIGIRAATGAITSEDFGTNANTDDAQLGTTVAHGSINGGSVTQGSFNAVGLTKACESKAAAGV